MVGVAGQPSNLPRRVKSVSTVTLRQELMDRSGIKSLGLRLGVMALFSFGTVGCVTQEATGEPAPSVSKAPHFRQKDPRWAGDRLGGSGETIADSGCTLCSVSMALSRLGIATDPKQLNRSLRLRNGYTGRGWIKWASVTQASGGKVQVIMDNSPSRSAIDSALARGEGVVAQIYSSRSGLHWVYLVAKESSSYVILDPAAKETGYTRLAASRVRAVRILRPSSNYALM